MGLIDTVSSVLEGSTQRAPSEGGDDGSSGAFWCDDCGVRVRDVDVDEEGIDLTDDDTPLCADCGEPMRFERATGSGCAC